MTTEMMQSVQQESQGKSTGLCLNVGCGTNPTPGWKNYDNSWSVRLAKKPVLMWILDKLGQLGPPQKEFIAVAKQTGILWADVARKIPEADGSVDVLYSCHMMEHLDKEQTRHFLQEARRLLKPGGILRVAVPNLRFHVNNFLEHKDADQFMAGLLMSRDQPVGLLQKLRYLIVGDRHHQWMYDDESLCKLLRTAGFHNPLVMEAGITTMPDPGLLNLRERAPESLFVEAVNP